MSATIARIRAAIRVLEPDDITPEGAMRLRRVLAEEDRKGLDRMPDTDDAA